MFDLITGATKHAPRYHVVPVLISVFAHIVVTGTILVGATLFVSEQLPEIPTTIAFVAAPPLPPPPPAPVVPKTTPTPAAPAPAPAAVTPVEAPPQIVPEAPVVDVGEPDVAADTSTVFGGIPGGLVGGLGFDIPPPPPPLRSPPPPREPIRVGGQVEQPTLVYRVDPIYPDVAAAAGIEGVVILEAIVDQEGRVEDLKVLRSNWILDRPALDAVRQWRYAPVLVNGRPERFILTVVVSFRLTDPT